MVQAIREDPHWQVRLRPAEHDARRVKTLAECWRIVEANKVSLRGWPYPCMPTRGEERENADTYVAAWCNWHELEDSARFGLAVRRAIEERYDGTVAILASGSLSHRFNDNGSPEESIHEISDEFYRQIDLRVVELWQQGDWKTFVKMLPTYNATCHGEGHMHDTAMLLGALGWDAYDRPVEIVTPYFASSGTGQINAVFPVTPLPR